MFICLAVTIENFFVEYRLKSLQCYKQAKQGHIYLYENHINHII